MRAPAKQRLAAASFDGLPFDGKHAQSQPKLVELVPRLLETLAPTVDETQVYLFKAGALEDAADLLGAHPMTRDGVAGFNVVVWAPNAKGVAVVGDFNGWQRTPHMMRRLHDSVFEIFEIYAPAGKHFDFVAEE